MWLKPEMNFRKVIETYGYPLISKEVARDIEAARHKPNGKTAEKFVPNNPYETKYNGRYSMVRWKNLKDSNIPISRQCCNIMKKKTAERYFKESGLRPIIGTMAVESQLRKTNWLMHGCNIFDSKKPTSAPLSFWTEQDVLEYIVTRNLEYAPVYGEIKQTSNGRYLTTGCQRTGCVFCGYGAHLEKEPNRFQRLKVTHPKLWNYCMKPWDEGGLGMREVLEYINVKVD